MQLAPVLHTYVKWMVRRLVLGLVPVAVGHRPCAQKRRREKPSGASWLELTWPQLAAVPDPSVPRGRLSGWGNRSVSTDSAGLVPP